MKDPVCRGQLKCDGTRAENRFRLSAKRTSPIKSAGASVQSTTGSRGVRISGSNAGYTMFRGSVKSTGYPLHSPVSSSLPLPCVTVCHHISTGVYQSSRIRHLPPEVGSFFPFEPTSWVCCVKVVVVKHKLFVVELMWIEAYCLLLVVNQRKH